MMFVGYLVGCGWIGIILEGLCYIGVDRTIASIVAISGTIAVFEFLLGQVHPWG
jgi:hypothetical protein